MFLDEILGGEADLLASKQRSVVLAMAHFRHSFVDLDLELHLLARGRLSPSICSKMIPTPFIYTYNVHVSFIVLDCSALV